MIWKEEAKKNIRERRKNKWNLALQFKLIHSTFSFFSLLLPKHLACTIFYGFCKCQQLYTVQPVCYTILANTRWLCAVAVPVQLIAGKCKKRKFWSRWSTQRKIVPLAVNRATRQKFANRPGVEGQRHRTMECLSLEVNGNELLRYYSSFIASNNHWYK